MKTVSWIILALVGALLVLGGLASVSIAYFGDPANDIITGTTSLQSLNLPAETTSALRARRGTAAAFALGFGTLLLCVVLGPYRAGSCWAWWAVLISTAVLCAATVLRMATLDLSQGAGTGGMIFLVSLIALLLDVRRLKC